MKLAIDHWLAEQTTGWVGRVQQEPLRVLALIGVLTLLLAAAAVFRLGINSNNLDLISPKLESRINHAEFSALFPNLENALLVVVDGDTPDLARKAAKRLQSRLTQMPSLVESAYLAQGGPFFEKNGLLYLNQQELEEFANNIRRARPFVDALEQQPNLVNLSAQIRVGMTISRGETNYTDIWTPFIEQLDQATTDVLADVPSRGIDLLSWGQSTLQDKGGFKLSRRQVIVAHPVLEFGSILAANRSITAIREAAADLEQEQPLGVSVRVTGNPALNLEEMMGIAWDIGVAGLFCFALVMVILTLALRSFPLVVATVATLLVGLVWTAGFAALAVGHLNIVSLSVAILFIGLGVDFAIHLGMRYADVLRSGAEERHAMQHATREVGSSLVICTISTAIAFLVFVPTPYLGVAELGLIAGAGMVIILFLTFTLFPALLVTWLKFDVSRHIRSELRFEASLGRWVQSHALLVRWVALGLLCIGIWMVPEARFDPNVIDMRDPDTESVQAFNELLDESGLASPWYIDAVAADLEQAKILAEKAATLASVEQTLTIADFVPTQQAEKLQTIDALGELYLQASPPPEPAKPDTAAKKVALEELRDFIVRRIKTDDQSSFAVSSRGLHERLNTLLASNDATAIDALEGELLANITEQIDRLRLALQAEGFTLRSLPSELRQRMLTADGQARIQFFPQENLRDEKALRRFVEEVQTVAPKVSGIAVNMLAFEEATKQSFAQALGSAVILISILLVFLWRNARDVLLVLAPLFLSLILAVAAMSLIDLPFNFVNVIVIPLMFGIGVDSGIHLVHRSHSTVASGDSLLGTTTARAVYYSALTTFISFGSLALSGHKGMASLGTLLAIGMALTVLCNLVLLPALLEWVRPHHRGHTTEQELA